MRRSSPSAFATEEARSVFPVPGSPRTTSGRSRMSAAWTALLRDWDATYSGVRSYLGVVLSGMLRRDRPLDRDDHERGLLAVGELDVRLLADLLAHDAARDRREVADHVVRLVGVPRTEDRVGLLLAR